MCVVTAFTSPLAGIATEYIMKRTKLSSDSLHTQNLHLYFFGIIFGMIGYFMEREPGEDFFMGWTQTTVASTIARIIAGLLVSVVIRYADSMVKVFSVSVSMFLTMIASVFLFDYQ